MTLLLDTHVLVWLAEGIELSREVIDEINRSAEEVELHVSVASAWEIGLLASKRGLDFAPSPKVWFAQVCSWPGVRLAEITPDIAIDSWNLPGSFHRDPADRLLVATARHRGMTLVTRDRRIVAYGQAGHLAVLAC